MTSENRTDQQASWLEQFKARCELDKIPEVIRDSFSDFLEHRAAVRAYYLSFSEDDFEVKTGEADTPQQELIHQIGHTYVRIDGLEMGEIPTWQYAQRHRSGQARLERMKGSELIERLDDSTELLYQYCTLPEKAIMVVQLPFGRSIIGARLISKMALHEALHLGMNVKYADQSSAPRPQEMKNIYG